MCECVCVCVCASVCVCVYRVQFKLNSREQGSIDIIRMCGYNSYGTVNKKTDMKERDCVCVRGCVCVRA